MLRLLGTLLLVLGLSGCAHETIIGRDFGKPSPQILVLGQTKLDEVERLMGEPYKQEIKTSSDSGVFARVLARSPFDYIDARGSHATINYFYMVKGQKTSIRDFHAMFFNDVLVGYVFLSNFSGESTDFDDRLLASLEKGHTTRAEAVSLLGPPAGHMVFPSIRDPEHEALVAPAAELAAGRARMALNDHITVLPDNSFVYEYYMYSVQMYMASLSGPVTAKACMACGGIRPRGR